MRLVARIEHPSHKHRKTVVCNSCFSRFAMTKPSIGYSLACLYYHGQSAESGSDFGESS
mgnify:CR=1 FL=1